MRQTFGRNERLKSKKVIDELFRSGKKLDEGPLRMVYLLMELPVQVPAQVAVSVPKGIMKRAVDRNKMKRLMREGYRRNKNILYSGLEECQKQCAAMIIYRGNVEFDSKLIEEKISTLLKRLLKEHA